MPPSIGFPPIALPNARILILGSLPGAESLRQHQYYAKKQNNFWRIMGVIAGAEPEIAYEKRLKQLTKHRIALWDVCKSAVRVGSLDSAIQMKTMKPNDFTGFFKTHKHIKLICFNGQPAAKLFARTVLADLTESYASIPRHILPSTSPAHARMRHDEKLALWREALDKII